MSEGMNHSYKNDEDWLVDYGKQWVLKTEHTTNKF